MKEEDIWERRNYDQVKLKGGEQTLGQILKAPLRTGTLE